MFPIQMQFIVFIHKSQYIKLIAIDDGIDVFLLSAVSHGKWWTRITHFWFIDKMGKVPVEIMTQWKFTRKIKIRYTENRKHEYLHMWLKPIRYKKKNRQRRKKIKSDSVNKRLRDSANSVIIFLYRVILSLILRNLP